MTQRREQIEMAASELYPEAATNREDDILWCGFVDGASWADANPETHNKYWIDRQNDLVKNLQTRDQAIELARGAMKEALTHFNSIMRGLTTDINSVEEKTKRLGYEAGLELTKALTAIDNLLKGQK